MSPHRDHHNAELLRWCWRSLAVGVVASVACAVGLVLDPPQFFRAYAYVYFFIAGLPLGSLALVMIYHLTGGAWGLLVRRILEAQMKTLPLVAVGFLPIAVGLAHIYLWADPAVDVAEEHQVVQQHYLVAEFFCWRAAGYFLIWLVLALFLSRWSARQDEVKDVRPAWKCSQLSGPGLVIFGVVLHFAALDWIMSLQSEFTSTIFGPLVFSGQMLCAFALAIVMLPAALATPWLRDLQSGDAINDLGSLLFTMLVLWAYMNWFQFMLIWMADLPGGTAWYLARLRGSWQWLAVALVLLHLTAPFFVLLLRTVKRNPRRLAVVAGWLLASHLAYMYLLIMPAFDAQAISRHWMDAVMPLALGGLWSAAFLWLLSLRPLAPRHDLNYRDAIHLRSIELKESAREEAVAHA